MKRSTQILFSTLAAAMLLAVSIPQSLLADSDRYEGREDKDSRYGRENSRDKDKSSRSERGGAAAFSPEYVKECGSCHIPYPAGMLPARSWDKVMTGLANHFGDSAELKPEIVASLNKYLQEQAGDRAGSRHYGKFAYSVPAQDTPLRLTETPHFRHEHGELRRAMGNQPMPVKSLSQCGECHTRAVDGSYSEREISIPGVGRWE